MEEVKKVLTVLLIILIIGIGGIWLANNDPRFLFSPLYCENATFTIIFGDKIYLSEKYVYKVNQSSKFRMLYRKWEIPLSFSPSLNTPFIKFLRLHTSNKADYYIKDFKGEVKGKLSSSLNYLLVNKLAQKNELGLVNYGYFKKGEYILSAYYILFPPIHTDGRFYHLNLKLANKHIPYRQVVFQIIDNNGFIDKIYPHFRVNRFITQKDRTIIKGTVGKNKLFEIEFILKKRPFSPFLYKLDFNVKKFTESINKWQYLSIN